jgi:hypothetical protein
MAGSSGDALASVSLATFVRSEGEGGDVTTSLHICV